MEDNEGGTGRRGGDKILLQDIENFRILTDKTGKHSTIPLEAFP